MPTILINLTDPSQLSAEHKRLLAQLIKQELIEKSEIKLSRQMLYELKTDKHAEPVKIQLSNSIIQTKYESRFHYQIIGRSATSTLGSGGTGRVKEANFYLKITKDAKSVKVKKSKYDTVVKIKKKLASDNKKDWTKEQFQEYELTKEVYPHTSEPVFRDYQVRKDTASPEDDLKFEEKKPTKKLAVNREEGEYDLEGKKLVNLYDSKSYLFMPKIPGEKLITFINDKELSLTERFEIAIACLEALEHVHQKNIVHRDLNARNIFYDPKTKKAHILDFGASTRNHEKTTKPYGNLYPPPEVAEQESKKQSDIFTLAGIIGEILRGENLRLQNMEAIIFLGDQKYIQTREYNFDSVLDVKNLRPEIKKIL